MPFFRENLEKKMSAFTPYKRPEKIQNEPSNLSLKKDQSSKDFIKFSLDLTSVLLELPNYHKSTFGMAYSCSGKGAVEEPEEKKEKFFIKNILKSDEAAERQRRERCKRKFEEEASKMETIVSNLGKSEDGHRCIYCGKVYSRKYGLKIHIRTHTGYKPLKCKYCLRPFGDPSNLNKHVRLHARGQTPYNCQFCGKILVRRRDLERHIKSKHSESF